MLLAGQPYASRSRSLRRHLIADLLTLSPVLGTFPAPTAWAYPLPLPSASAPHLRDLLRLTPGPVSSAFVPQRGNCDDSVVLPLTRAGALIFKVRRRGSAALPSCSAASDI